jgi:sugar lactone lactonase YvrE
MAKPSIDPVVWQPPKAPARAKQRRSDRDVTLSVFDLPGVGPEDVVIDSSGRVLAGLRDGRIVRISPDGGHVETVADTGGRPLGLEIDAEANLLVCDSHRGLLHVELSSGAVRTLVDRIDGVPMVFCSNCVVAADGTIFFSESSQRVSVDHFKADILEHSNTGRLTRLGPDGRVDVIANGLQFANGLVLAQDESWIAVAETTGYCITKIWLTGPRAGEREALVENLPGFPDNMSWGSDGLMWVALASPRNPIVDLLAPRAAVLRKIAWGLPDALQPKEKQTVWVQAYDFDGVLIHDLQTTHDRFHMATGVKESNGSVWIGSLAVAAIARIDLR